MITHTSVDELERVVLRMHLDIAKLEGRLDTLAHLVERFPQEAVEPPPELEATIRSLHESNVDLRGQLADAKQTERDLDAEVARLTKENQRLTQLAWQAEQDKRALDTAAKALTEELMQRIRERDDYKRRLDFECGERAAMRDERDELSLRLADERRQREAMVQRALELRRGLLSVLGVTEKEG